MLSHVKSKWPQWPLEESLALVMDLVCLAVCDLAIWRFDEFGEFGDLVGLAIWRLDDTGTHHGHHYQSCTRRRSNGPMVLFGGIKSRIISRTQRNHGF